jgi:tetratricopeptide (TPR) repeat protein
LSISILLLLLSSRAPLAGDDEEIWRHHNLGKAFYENPTTQLQAVEEFKKALELAPNSAQEQLNYGLALLRAGKLDEGIAELKKVQKEDPSIPHTWFNLGVVFKKAAQYDRAIEQFQGMVERVPEEPVSHYNLGVLYKLTGKPDLALKEFEAALRLDPNLAGPHFQLSNAYRAAGGIEDADREFQLFQQIKKRQAGAVIPEDLEWSSYAEIYDVVEPRGIEKDASVPALKFKSAEVGNVGAGRAGLAVLDADGDGLPDLLVWTTSQVRLYRKGSEPVENSGLAGLRNVISIAPGDYNNDGLADLCVLTDLGATLYLNKKGTFQKQDMTLPPGSFTKAVWLDFDHDGDIDLFLLGPTSALARNDGSAGFSDHSSEFPFVRGTPLDGTAYDLIKDTNGTDLVVTFQDRAAVLYRDKLAGKFEALSLEGIPAGTQSILAYDFDNDGWTDLAGASSSGVLLVRNAQGKLENVPAPAGAKGPVVFVDLGNRGLLDLIAGGTAYLNQGSSRFSAGQVVADLGSIDSLTAADFDGDGLADLVAVSSEGKIRLLRDETAAKNHWIRVGLLGVRNLQLAPGAKVEVKSGALYQKRTYQGVPLLFGLRSYPETDTVRITWPNGLIQNEIKQASGKALVYREKQRLSGSCPMIFAWNGQKFEFITDVLGVAPLGASSGDGQYFPVDHDEYIQIPGETLKQVGDHYEIRISEELHEVAYLDRVQLIAADHSADLDIFTNVKFQSPPYPALRMYGASRRVYPKAARDQDGRDVLGRISRRDRVYPDSFRRDYSGTAEMHYLDLDFGAGIAPDNRALLVLNGWVDWADGSTFLRVSQERKGGLVMPYLQVKDGRGRWRTVLKDMGIPAGKPKTIVVDLSGKFLSTSRQVRIVTNVCVYWDEIFLSEFTGIPPVSLTPMNTNLVELRFGGFSTPVIHPDRKQPEWFDYSHRTSFSSWNPTRGFYTRYGDVRALLEAADDRFVIMGSGDELRFLFDASHLSPVRRGFKRDFLLYVDGWAKDADLNTAFSQTVEPLPFHSMTRYPYGSNEHYPDDKEHAAYRQLYNTRPALRLLRPLNEQLASK